MKEKKVVDIDVVVFKGVTKTTTQQNKNKKTEYVRSVKPLSWVCAVLLRIPPELLDRSSAARRGK